MRGRIDSDAARNRGLIEEIARKKPNGNGHKKPEPANWLALCQRGKGGGLVYNLHNTLLALRLDPVWKDRLLYDQMAHTALLDAEPLSDVALFRIHEWLQANGLIRVALDVVREAVALVAREHPFHPIRDWLTDLQWDGTDRLWSWLHRLVGTPDDEYHRQVGGLFLTAMVARVFEPGCQSDYTLVLEGPQKQLKSSLCRLIAGTRHFSASLPPLDGDPVRLSMHLRGKWLIEVSELSAFQRADNEKLKAFLTNQVEQFTPKFAREEVFEPRQCLFIATTNKFTWMKDETGGRRFWPVRAAKIKLDDFAAERDQLFAQATDHYLAHHQWWPDNEVENSLFKPQQTERYEADAWETPIVDWDHAIPAGRDFNGNVVRQTLQPPFYLVDIANGALNIPTERFGVREQRRLVSTLEFLNWRRSPRTKRGIPWNPPGVLV